MKKFLIEWILPDLWHWIVAAIIAFVLLYYFY